MTLKQYLLLMSFTTALCWVVWFFIILNIDPNQAGVGIFLFFYLSLLSALIGTFSVIGFLIKRFLIKNDDLVFRHVKKTFRQSIIISVLIAFSLFLLQKNLLTWWNEIMLILLAGTLEGIVFTNRRFRNQDYV